MSISTIFWLALFVLIVFVWRRFLAWAQDRWFPAPPVPAEPEEGEEGAATEGDGEAILEAEPAEDTRSFRLIGYSSFLMWRTERGRNFLDKVARLSPTFWRRFADVGLILVFIIMVGMMALLIWQATMVPSIPKSRAPSPKLLIGLPGLNPVIPLWYGILALAVAIVIHEFCHGFLARTAKVRVKTMGLLFFIFPVGAFVEPDEEQMTNMPRWERMRLYAAGPTSNIFLALILGLIFSWGFMGALEPVEEGALIRTVTVHSADEVPYPAEQAGLEPWMLIVEVEGQSVSDIDDFSDVMAETYAGQNITMVVLDKGQRRSFENITLVDKGDYWLKYYPDDYEPEMAGQGFLGVATANPREITDWLAHPLRETGERGRLKSMLLYITLPFAKLQPFPETFTALYEPTGGLGVLPDSLFWVTANIFYWVFWLNLMVGLTNALPAQPLDGGFIFADGLTGTLKRLKGIRLTSQQKENLAANTTLVFSFSILFLLLFQIVGPRVFGADLEDFDAEFTVSAEEVLVGQTVTFDASPSRGDFARYEWNFGDGSPKVSGEELRVDHTYEYGGRYAVVLWAYTAQEGRSVAFHPLVVNLNQADSGNLEGGESDTYPTRFNSVATQIQIQGTIQEDGASQFASGTVSLETPQQSYSQDFTLTAGSSDSFDWEVSSDGPGNYTLTIRVDNTFAANVKYMYTFEARFEA